MSVQLDQIILYEAARLGWDVKVVGEARLAVAMSHAGVSSSAWETQFQLGPYRLDFAHPLYRIDVEADGWVHTAARVKRRDTVRDRQLQAWGWRIIRVDSDNEAAIKELARDLRSLVADMPRYDGTLFRVGEREFYPRLQAPGR